MRHIVEIVISQGNKSFEEALEYYKSEGHFEKYEWKYLEMLQNYQDIPAYKDLKLYYEKSYDFKIKSIKYTATYTKLFPNDYISILQAYESTEIYYDLIKDIKEKLIRYSHETVDQKFDKTRLEDMHDIVLCDNLKELQKEIEFQKSENKIEFQESKEIQYQMFLESIKQERVQELKEIELRKEQERVQKSKEKIELQKLEKKIKLQELEKKIKLEKIELDKSRLLQQNKDSNNKSFGALIFEFFSSFLATIIKWCKEVYRKATTKFTEMIYRNEVDSRIDNSSQNL